MKRSVFILVFTIFAAFAAPAQVNVGMTDTASYYPLLRGRRVAVLANQTSVAELPGAPGADASGRVHLVDLLHGEGFAVAAIFSPEHGFRGTADAGERVASSVDARTGIPIRSLYDGNAKRPSDEAMRSFDVLVVDMQDVGLRFYTYYISMLRMMDACADFGANRAGERATAKGFSQVLWMDAIHHKYVEEGGGMNVMFKLGGKVVTPMLTGSILRGITRMSCLELMRSWGLPVEERLISIDELAEAADAGTLEEAWCVGTAAVICPIGELYYNDKPYIINHFEIGETAQRLYDNLTGIQWGRLPDPFGWTDLLPQEE